MLMVEYATEVEGIMEWLNLVSSRFVWLLFFQAYHFRLMADITEEGVTLDLFFDSESIS